MSGPKPGCGSGHDAPLGDPARPFTLGLRPGGRRPAALSPSRGESSDHRAAGVGPGILRPILEVHSDLIPDVLEARRPSVGLGEFRHAGCERGLKAVPPNPPLPQPWPCLVPRRTPAPHKEFTKAACAIPSGRPSAGHGRTSHRPGPELVNRGLGMLLHLNPSWEIWGAK